MPLPKSKTYDTVVVGTGPAGLMAAYEASLRHDVLLVDSSGLPRNKPCGGMIHDASVRALEGVARIPERLALSPRTLGFRFHDWDRGIRKQVDLSFINVDRAAFDEWLRETIVPSDVEVLPRCVLQEFAVDEEGVVVSLKTDEGPAAVRCGNLIGADGARSTVRRCLGGQAPAVYVTLQDHVELNGEIDPVFDCLYMRDIGDDFAYGYILPKGRTAIVGSVFYPRTRRPGDRHDQMLATIRGRLPQVGASLRREAAPAVRLGSADNLVHGRGRVLLAGEAGGFMSPTSGEGISYALESGRAAGRAVAGSSPAEALEAYRKATAPLVRDIRRRLRWLPAMESKAGKFAAGHLPTTLVSRLTLGL